MQENFRYIEFKINSPLFLRNIYSINKISILVSPVLFYDMAASSFSKLFKNGVLIHLLRIHITYLI